MKKIVAAMLLSVMFLCAACSGGNSQADAVNPNFEMSQGDIIAMSNYMNGGNTAVSGTWIYGLSFKSNGNGVLTKIKTDGTEQTKLASKASRYINIIDGWIYYLAFDWSASQWEIDKTRVSGEDETVLVSALGENRFLDYIFIYNDMIYYCELDESGDIPTGSFKCCDLNGENTKTVLDKAVYYPYILNDKIYYQDDNDYCRIHVCDLDGENDVILIDECVYNYVSDGNSIYYLTYENKELDYAAIREDYFCDKRIIRRCDMDGSNDETIIDFTSVLSFEMNGTNQLFYTDYNDECRLYSYDLESGEINLISQDNSVLEICIFENSLSYFDYDDDFRYIDNIYYCDLDGTNKIEIFK